jgi:ABC-type lipoprotein export system ATPase subunit
MEVKKGEFVAIMGPSGCGKSTLLNILGMIDNPSEGTYIFNDVDVSRYKESKRTQYRRGNIQFIFQSFNLIDELNVYDNVELPLLYLKKSASERRERVLDILVKGISQNNYQEVSSSVQPLPVPLCRLHNLFWLMSLQETSIPKTALK